MTDTPSALERVPTGIPGLDIILKGGLFRGGVYIVRGAPGAGKTILGNQVCFHHVAGGNRGLYVTLLAESHARMMQHMRTLRFFDEAAIPSALYYVSAFNTLEEDGLKGLLDLLRREIRARGVTLMVLDGMLAIEESSQSDREFRKFVHELQAHAALSGCTILLLTNGSRRDYHPEHTMVDGLLTIEDVVHGGRAERALEIRKFRGGSYLRGRHAFRITDEGIVVFPRIEALLARPTVEDECRDENVSTGVPQLDRMLGGGLSCGTTTLLLGPAGGGKTTLGLHFLAQSSAAEPGLLFGFYETPSRALLKARRLGLDLERLVAAGQLEMLWHPPTEQVLDELGNRLLDAVRRRGVKRLFVDGLPGFREAATDDSRIAPFFTALSNEFRTHSVTTVYTIETHSLVGPTVEAPATGLSTVTENLILLRYVELRARLYRLISVIKARDNDFDATLREFRITDHGVSLADTFDSAEAILSGFPHAPGDAEPESGAAPQAAPEG